MHFKKTALVVIFSMITALICVNAETVFTDLNTEHWAWESVIALANEKTINGYSDGSFKPNETVTKAEFLKMIGKGNKTKEVDYSDVPKDHWAYEYIFTGELGAEDGNEFMPNKPITREQTMLVLHSRYGMDFKDISAPNIIKNQSKNKEAVSFVYMYGIMNGNDGVNLRLNDSLTRAEAAVLITRGKNIKKDTTQINFVDKVSKDILQNVYEGIHLFENNAYDENRKFTGGEMAQAALRFSQDKFDIDYSDYMDIHGKFDGKYARDMAVLAEYCLGDKKNNEEYANGNVNIIDSIIMLIYGASLREKDFLNESKNMYSDISGSEKDNYKAYISGAFEKGIILFGDKKINPYNEITAKELSAILVLLDEEIGTQVKFSIGKKIGKSYDRISNDIKNYPANAEDYMCILKNVPNFVYESNQNAQTRGKNTNPKAQYDFAREYNVFFINQINKLIKRAADMGVEIKFDFYPSMVYDNGKGFTTKALCSVENVNKNTAYDEVFGQNQIKAVEGNLEKNQQFFLEINTGYNLFD